MAFQEQQVMKALTLENNRKENKGGKFSKQSEEESHHLEEVKNKKPGGDVRKGQVRRTVPNFQCAIPNRHGDYNERKGDVGKFVGQVIETKRKSRVQERRPHMCFRTLEPDNTNFASYLKIKGFLSVYIH
ncbi:protein BEX4 [Psammomys obesus]|uniref:protein BEX4 n=1 Tax=Psammomys obesus TaxID=48139 RepID=UPI0024536E08|nr:protein BEX4 [Psammomys obesus]